MYEVKANQLGNDYTISTSASDWIVGEKEGLVSLDSQNLNINYYLGTHLYLVFKEKTPNFNNPPSQSHLNLIPNKLYYIEYNVEQDSLLTSNLYIIEYDSKNKINTHIIKPGEKKLIKIKNTCQSTRIAIRLSGKGDFKLLNIDIKQKEEYEATKESINMQYSLETKIKDVKELKIAAIVDYFTKICLNEECRLITFTTYDWLETLERERPDILFVESAWQGNDGSWQYKIGKYYNQDKSEITNLIAYCKAKGIPTIFWNKEDPVHFEKFIETAKLFDHIFTSDRNMIKKYKEICKHNNIYDLPFAAQPKLHNPISNIPRKDGICFAGTYYGDRHEERRNDMNKILKICQKYNLYIYDRNYKINKDNINHPTRFPEEFKKNIVGSLDYKDIDKAYKGYRVLLNVNSVKYSPTMFSRRVFESLACGTPIISTYSKGISELFRDIVICDTDNLNIEKLLRTLILDEAAWKEKSLKGIREVMLKYTYSDRLRYVLSKLDINIKKDLPMISCIIFVNSFKELEDAVDVFNSQNYLNKELILIMQSNFDGFIHAMNNYNTDKIRCFIGNYIEKNYDDINDIAKGKYVTYLRLDNKYGENYLVDMVTATIYTNAQVIGKSSYYKNYNYRIKEINQEQEYTFTDKILSDRCMISKEVLSAISIKDIFDAFRRLDYIKEINQNQEYRFISEISSDRYSISKELLSKIKIKSVFDLVRKKDDTQHLQQSSVFSIDNNNFLEDGSSYTDTSKINRIFI